MNPMSGAQSYTINPAGAFAPGNAPAYNFGPLNYYQRPNKRYTVGSFLNFALNDKAEVYGEFNFLKDQSVSQIAPSGLFTLDATVSCANPLWTAAQFTAFCGQFGLGGAGGVQDPTTTDTTIVRFNRRNIEGGGRQQDLEHSAYRAGFGVKGDINEAWSYDASLFQGTSRISNTYLNDFSIARSGRALNVVPGPAGPTCASVLDGSDPNCVPYNIWAADSVTAGALNYVQIPLVSVGEVTERVLNSTFTVDLGQYGLKLAAEDGVFVNFGVEMREVETNFQPAYAMTGWRVGYVIAPPEFAELLSLHQEPVISCASTISQHGALTALRGPQECVGEMVAAYRNRRGVAAAELDRFEVPYVWPTGGFFMMADISATGMDSWAFCRRLLDETSVAVVPGAAFGARGENYVRVSLASSDENVAEGMRRMAAFIAEVRAERPAR